MEPLVQVRGDELMPASSERENEPRYEVGYSRPPKATRFQPGQSGNPRGRPRGAKNRKSIVGKVASEIQTVNGRSMTTLEVMLMVVRNEAASGNVRAFAKLEKLLNRINPEAATGVLLVPAPVTAVEWHRAFSDPATFAKFEAEGVFEGSALCSTVVKPDD